MFLLLLLLLVLLLLIGQMEFKCAKIRQQIRHTDGPAVLPLVGNALSVGQTANVTLNYLFDCFYKYAQQNFRLWVSYLPYIFVVDTKDVEYILNSNTLIAKSDAYDLLRPWLGDGLLTSKGSKWHKHRKMITPSFHFNILQDFQEIMKLNSSKFIEKLQEASKGDRPFDFQDMVHYLTMDVICDTAMGVHINVMDNPNSEFVLAVQYLCYNMHKRIINPLKRKFFTYKFFPEFKEYCRHLKVVKDFTYEVIEKRIESREEEEEARKSKTDIPENEYQKRKVGFLDALLSATVDGRPLTREEVYEEVSTFMFEGHDTTTSAITFTVFLLSRHLEVQKKVFEEQLQVMGGDLKRDANFQEVNEMKYLEMVIKESLRLYPSVPLIGRFTETEYNMNGKILPQYTSLIIFVMAMGYRESVYPDPYRFDPERFAPSNRSNTQNPFEYIPFSAGPRNCVGQKFAMLEVKTVISRLVRHFEILPAADELVSKDGYVSTRFGPNRMPNNKLNKYEPLLSAVLTLKSDNGIYLRLKERV